MLSGIESFLVEKYGIEIFKWLSRKLLYEGKYEKIKRTLVLFGFVCYNEISLIDYV